MATALTIATMSPHFALQIFIYSVCLNLFSLFTYLVYYSNYYLGNFYNDIQPEYDYVIGAGSAGSVIAHRLATETNHSFIVLEAGSKGHFILDIPIVGPALHRSVFDWMYETVPQEHACYAMENKVCKLPQGKILGGSSKLNNMIHVRGNISDYVQWFHRKHSENYIIQQFQFIEDHLVHLNDIQYESELADVIIKASKELNYDSFAKCSLSQKLGKRWSTSDNLDLNSVITNALVTKIIIKDKKAIGVSFVLGNANYQVFARKGVIISAGAFNTPKILQLSGIGPSKLLNSLNIPVIKDLPVGENLQDHIGTGLDLILMDRHPKLSGNDILDPFNHISYYFQGKGPLTTSGAEITGFVSTKNDSVIDLQYMVLPTGITADRGTHLRNVLDITDKVWEEYFVTLFENYTGSIVPILLHPKSRGTVLIKSTAPEDPPVIDPKYLSHTEDRQTLVRGLKIVQKLLQTKSLEYFQAYINPKPFPGCEKYKIFTDDYWECYIKYLTLSIYHPVGTCAMGLPGEGVVNTDFKVFGVDNLYVVDASVLPYLPSGNPNAAVIMMASVFFDSNIKRHSERQVCAKNDFFREYLFRICLVAEFKPSIV